MQRTLVIYGVATATLVAAFLLAPKKKALEPEPLPPPPPAPVALSPVTDLTYADGTVEVRARLDRGLLLRQGASFHDEPVWMDVSIKAVAAERRAPLTAVLVVDRSGSMAGDKIEAARQAAERFVASLRDGDQLAVVTFGTDVSVDLALTTIDGRTRDAARRVVSRIEEGGGTNIQGGLLAARDLLSRADLAGRTGRIVFVSDGRPTEGERRTSQLVKQAEEVRGAGVTMSTLGLGLDYNEDLMEALAVTGGGRYHYLRAGHELAAILDAELKHATNVAAAGVKIHFPSSFAGLRVVSAPGHELSLGERAVLHVGDLAAGEERHVLVKLDVDRSVGGGATVLEALRFAAPEVVYRPVASQEPQLLAHRGDHFRMLGSDDVAAVERSRVEAVRVRVLQVEASIALTESMKDFAEGNVASAKQKLEAKKAKLQAAAARTGDAALAREAAAFDSALGTVQSAAPSSTEGLDFVKSQKARAFQLRR